MLKSSGWEKSRNTYLWWSTVKKTCLWRIDHNYAPVRIGPSRRRRLSKLRDRRRGVREQRKAVGAAIRKLEVSAQEMTDLGACGRLWRWCIEVDHCYYEGSSSGIEDAPVCLDAKDWRDSGVC